MADEKNSQEQAPEPKVKKPYNKPRVTDYGSVRAVTLGSGPKKPDKGSKSASGLQ